MNSIILLGRATSAIELKQTQAGKTVVSFSLAVKRPFSKDTTDFFTICAWDKQAELLSKYVGKGDQICIRGYLMTRSWEDGNGDKRYATEVVASEVSFCEAKRDSEGNNASQNQNATEGDLGVSQFIPEAYRSQGTPRFEDVNPDDNLPF